MESGDRQFGRRMGFESDAMDASPLASLRHELKRRDDAYEATTGIKSSREIIARDPEWEEMYQQLKRAEMALAESTRKPGGCARYIPRRRRFCASRAADGCDGFCSLHAPSLGDRQISAPGREHRERPIDAPAPASVEDGGDGPSSSGANAAADNRRKTNIHRRMKKMTNPMAAPHRVPVEAPDWPTVFKDPTLPTFIDVGCAKGRFLQRAATVDREVFEAAHGRHNLLGLEIDPPIVEDANLWTRTHDVNGELAGDGTEGAEGAGAIGNLHFVACNANVSLAGMRVPNVRMVSVLFPDPWSRRKHAGRRVVTAQFVNTLASALVEGARVYCCSDVRPLAAEMQALFLGRADAFALDEDTFARCGEMKDALAEEATSSERRGGATEDGGFEHVFPAHQYRWQGQKPSGAEANEEAPEEGSFLTGGVEPRWLAANPVGVPTERDLVCESKWRPVYRFVVRRL